MIQLGEFRKLKEEEEMKKYHTRLINELEKEKKKLEEEIVQVSLLYILLTIYHLIRLIHD